MMFNEKEHSECNISESSFSPSSCTRKSYSNCLQRLKRTYKKHKANPLPPMYKARLDGPSSVWKVFKRLQMAVEYADAFAKDCMVFSYEEKADLSGLRMFLVAHPEHMWVIHRTRPAEVNCSYEVIRENYPCKLYFDLEFYTCFNPGKDGNHMTKIFIKCVIAAMLQQHDLKIRESDFLWLDATTDQKFSCHLILQMKNVAFKNNIQAGIFVSLLISSLEVKLERNSPSEGLWPSADEIKCLLVTIKNDAQKFFCDRGVYSKNRNFRLYLSSKHGKRNPLVLSSYNQHILDMKKCANEKEAIFYHSLITYFRNSSCTRLLSYDDLDTSATSVFNSFFERMPNNKPGVSGFISSPFPDCDKFINSIIRDEFATGFIRKWTYFCNEQKIFYDIGNYRYCHNIGRHHKSNNIRLVVDMKNKCYFQKCLDPDCRLQGFQSEAMAVPQDISFINVPDDFFDLECFSDLPCEDNQNEICSVSATDCFNELPNSEFTEYLEDDNIYEDLTSGFGSFTQLSKMCDGNDTNKRNGSNISQSQYTVDKENNVNFWNTFFFEEFSDAFTDDSKGKYKNDFSVKSSRVIFHDFTNFASVPEDFTKNSLENVSLEEELLMAEAVAATEATSDESMMSEETVF